ncbi:MULTISPECIES: efflux RND transporter periplasmic adaptor subunit [Vibrio]|uniref:HlyD family efflux transporter periplasmic adaptor subunit n=1 Tax=Vibrio casei TaxID=673372 RepID=A0A368LPX2_9VIBR|nr:MULTISPECIES: efflux RND transporter periplasmic adaptor subunit [Vibrio]RCS73865.1 HlyD family efflux transporter periplasmic adaptor subunit [Vibrio casei]SJN31529.1 Membrane fusion component of tripartite multidrug resistance system [Vibrio casei]HBV77232.1 EmrA/EmrK family multidrug efflux transporter periplasmic adaptor subunit [Vibrio sp.]
MENKQKNIEDSSTPKNKRKASFFILFILLLVIAGGYIAYYELYSKYYEETDDAYVNGDLVVLSPQIVGTVSQVVPDEGDYVEKGQVLVMLDSNDTQIALQLSEAKLASKIREVRSMYAEADNFKAKVETSKVEYRQALNDYNRRKNLVKSGAISKEDLIHYRDNFEAAKSQLQSAEQSLQMTVALVDNTVINTHPGVKSAVANLRQAYLANLRTKIVSPVSGYVAKRAVQLGTQVQPGSQLMAIVPLHQVWVDANFKESQLKDMRIGQSVILTSDLYGDDVEYKGIVESLGIGTGSAFSLLPAQNASGNWIKIVQRLPVKIRLEDQNQDKYPLRIGLSMLANVNIKDTSGKVLAKESKTEARYSTDVYQSNLAEADKLVAKIVHENVGITATVQ